MVSYHRHAITCCSLVLYIVALSRPSEQISKITSTPNQYIGGSQFGQYSPSIIACSPNLLRFLAENEEIIYILIKDFYTKYVPNYRLLKAPAKEPFKSIHRAYKAAWNPITTYLMFQRYLKPFRTILFGLNKTQEAEFALGDQISHIMRRSGWPTMTDLQFTINAILRIQDLYDLSTYDLSVGKIAGYETGVNLSAVDCVEIGKQALFGQEKEPYYALAVEWFELGQRKLKRNSRLQTTSGSISKAEIEHYINLSQDRHDDHWYKSKKSEPLVFTTPFDDAATRVRRRASALKGWKGSTHVKDNLVNYWGTCTGANYKSEPEKKKLFCWFETEMNYSLKIKPLKAELLSIEPLFVIQYYGVIRDKVIKKIKLDSVFKLKQAKLPDGRIDTSARTSSSHIYNFASQEKDFYFPMLNTIEAATGLKVKSRTDSEFLLVEAYTVGSHLIPQTDPNRQTGGRHTSNNPNGNHIATFMYYLADVEKGGETSFPQSGIAVKPVKGSAVLWFNLRRNGQVDPNTWHGSCPVIIGEKWIGKKWILSDDQMFLPDYQCVPDQTTPLRLLINGKDLRDLV